MTGMHANVWLLYKVLFITAWASGVCHLLQPALYMGLIPDANQSVSYAKSDAGPNTPPL